jgi:hypothetical protein
MAVNEQVLMIRNGALRKEEEEEELEGIMGKFHWDVVRE